MRHFQIENVTTKYEPIFIGLYLVFFCSGKFFLILFEIYATNHASLGRYGAERGNEEKPQPFRIGKGVNLLKPSHFEQTIEHQFDSLAKKVMDAVVKKYHRDMKRRSRHEAPFSDLSNLETDLIHFIDEYESDYTAFEVLGEEVHVADDKLVDALKSLPEKKLDIIMMFYFMDMSDTEIAEVLELNRSTVYRHRTSTLEKIKKIMEE